MKPFTTGLLLGKFMPPTRGHEYMIDFARRMADELTIHVCSIPSEPIPGHLRYEWVRDHFGGVRVVHADEDKPNSPEDDPDHFWDIWREVLMKRMPCNPDFVFASEGYGARLAVELNAKYIPVDPNREIVPISATAIRCNPMKHWEFILPEARSYYVKRVVICGPESSGKSTLSKHLAEHFKTSFVCEYGRTYQENIGRDLRVEDMARIARAHVASEEATAKHSNRVLCVDTEAIITKLWSLVFFGEYPAELDEMIAAERYHLYLLTMPHESEWHQDGWRLQPDYAARLRFFNEMKASLDQRNRPYHILQGSWEERTADAIEQVEHLIK